MKWFVMIVRALIGLVFIFSAVVKLYPAEILEIALVETRIIGWTLAPFAARLLIGFELLLGLFLIAGIYRKHVIHVSLGVLAVFTVYLFFLLGTGSNEENCNCFGAAFEMTPLQSIIKNIVLIALLLFIKKADNTSSRRPNYIKYIALGMVVPSFVLPFLLSFITIADTSWKENPINRPLQLEQFYDNPDFIAPAVDLREGKWLLAIVTNSCPYCVVAGYKLSVIEKKIDGLPLFLFIAGTQESAEEFHFQTKTADIPYSLVQMKHLTELLSSGSVRFPSILFVSDGIVQYMPTTHAFTEKDVENWLGQ